MYILFVAWQIVVAAASLAVVVVVVVAEEEVVAAPQPHSSSSSSNSSVKGLTAVSMLMLLSKDCNAVRLFITKPCYTNDVDGVRACVSVRVPARTNERVCCCGKDRAEHAEKAQI